MLSCCTGNASACFGEEDRRWRPSSLEILPEISRTLLARLWHGDRNTKTRYSSSRRGSARRDLPGCPYALVYTSVMMVYGRWRRRPRSGRVGHAVNRRTRPRQNLLYTAERRAAETGESRAGGFLARLRADARALSLITSSGSVFTLNLVPHKESRSHKITVLSKTDATSQIMNPSMRRAPKLILLCRNAPR